MNEKGEYERDRTSRASRRTIDSLDPSMIQITESQDGEGTLVMTAYKMEEVVESSKESDSWDPSNIQNSASTEEERIVSKTENNEHILKMVKNDTHVCEMLTSINLVLVKKDGQPTSEFSEAFLGKGSFGYVLRARHEITEHFHAVKIIDVRKLQEKRRWSDAEREMTNTTELKHENIVRFFNPVRVAVVIALNSLLHLNTKTGDVPTLD